MTSILAVDDSTSLRQMVAHTLQNAGYDAIEAGDGVEALRIAKSKKVNLVLTDVNMPNKDGISLIRELRALPDYKLVPMLMLTTESTQNKNKKENQLAPLVG